MIRTIVTAAAVTLAVTLSACEGAEQRAGVTAGAPAPGGGLSVAEAIDTDAEPPLLVQGLLRRGEQGILRLCEVALESYPPQCGGASLVVEGVALEDVRGDMQEDSGVAWIDQASLLGEVQGNRFVVSQTSL